MAWHRIWSGIGPGRLAAAVRGRAGRSRAAPVSGPSFAARIEQRRQLWLSARRNPGEATRRRHQIAMLVNKSRMFDYARQHGIPVPARHGDFAAIGDIDFAALPDRVVIKPDNAANCDGVLLFDGETELLSGQRVPRDDRSYFTRKAFALSGRVTAGTRIIVEELIADYDPQFRIPRDFKLYVAGGRAQIMSVIDRNGPQTARNQSFYERDWTPIADRFQTGYRKGPIFAAPSRLDELLALADRIAADIGCFMRLDFFISPDRVVFGEFTSLPGCRAAFHRIRQRAPLRPDGGVSGCRLTPALSRPADAAPCRKAGQAADIANQGTCDEPHPSPPSLRRLRHKAVAPVAQVLSQAVRPDHRR